MKECWKVRMIFIMKPDEWSKERIWPKRTYSMICRRQIYLDVSKFARRSLLLAKTAE